MADEQSSQQQTTQAADEVITAPAEKRLDLPEAASKDLTWEADGQRIDYTATAAHLDVRTDTGSLIGKMFSLSYVSKPEGEKSAAEALLPKVTAMLDKLAKHNIMHKNKAANLKSSIQLHVNAL